MSAYYAEHQRRATGLPLRHLDMRPRASAGGTGADVVAHLDALETRVAPTLDAIAQLHQDATAVAGEHGHMLGPWYESEHLLTAALCTSCGVGVALRDDGYGSNADPTRFLREHPCARERFYVAKSGKGTGWTYVVRDRERAAFGPRAMGSKGKCAKVARALNAEHAPAVAIDIGELDRARLKVERARKSLERAEGALRALEARMVDGACEAPNVAHALLAACEQDGSLDERRGALVLARFESGPVRPMARAGSGFSKGKRGKR